MQKPNSYSDVTVGGDFTPIELGGHRAVIKNVEELQSKTGKPMIKVSIDFDQTDKQPGYFMAAFKNDTRDGKKWPFQATQYILTEDADGKCSRSFKSFITSVEKSNGCECVWGEGFCAWFKDKKVGVVYGANEEEYNGEVKTRNRIRFFCQYDKADQVDVPTKRFLQTAAPATTNDDFLNVDTDETIPF